MNKIKDENKIVITDEKNQEHVLEILFTYFHEERQKNYVFFYDPLKEDEIMVMSFNDNGELFDLESDEEFEEAEEILEAFNEDPKIQEIK